MDHKRAPSPGKRSTSPTFSPRPTLGNPGIISTSPQSKLSGKNFLLGMDSDSVKGTIADIAKKMDSVQDLKSKRIQSAQSVKSQDYFPLSTPKLPQSSLNSQHIASSPHISPIHDEKSIRRVDVELGSKVIDPGAPAASRSISPMKSRIDDPVKHKKHKRRKKVSKKHKKPMDSSMDLDKNLDQEGESTASPIHPSPVEESIVNPSSLTFQHSQKQQLPSSIVSDMSSAQVIESQPALKTDEQESFSHDDQEQLQTKSDIKLDEIASIWTHTTFTKTGTTGVPSTKRPNFYGTVESHSSDHAPMDRIEAVEMSLTSPGIELGGDGNTDGDIVTGHNSPTRLPPAVSVLTQDIDIHGRAEASPSIPAFGMDFLRTKVTAPPPTIISGRQELGIDHDILRNPMIDSEDETKGSKNNNINRTLKAEASPSIPAFGMDFLRTKVTAPPPTIISGRQELGIDHDILRNPMIDSEDETKGSKNNNINRTLKSSGKHITIDGATHEGDSDRGFIAPGGVGSNIPVLSLNSPDPRKIHNITQAKPIKPPSKPPRLPRTAELKFEELEYRTEALRTNLDFMISTVASQKKCIICLLTILITLIIVVGFVIFSLVSFPIMNIPLNYNLPVQDGKNDQYLRSDGTGHIEWVDDTVVMTEDEQIALIDGSDADSLHTHDSLMPRTWRGLANGVASLNSNGYIPSEQLNMTSDGSIVTRNGGQLMEHPASEENGFVLVYDTSSPTNFVWKAGGDVIPESLVSGGTTTLHDHDDIYLRMEEFNPGTNNQFMISQASSSEGFVWSSLLTNRGSLMTFNGSNITEVSPGADGYFLVSSASDTGTPGIEYKSAMDAVPQGLVYGNDADSLHVHPSLIRKDVLTNQGALITKDDSGEVVELVMTSNSDYILVSDPTTSTGMAWATPESVIGLSPSTNGSIVTLDASGDLSQMDISLDNAVLYVDYSESSTPKAVWHHPLDIIPELSGGSTVDASSLHTHDNLAGLSTAGGTVKLSHLALSSPGDITIVNSSGDLDSINIGTNSLITKNSSSEVVNVTPLSSSDDQILVSLAPDGVLEWKNDSYILTPANFGVTMGEMLTVIENSNGDLVFNNVPIGTSDQVLVMKPSNSDDTNQMEWHGITSLHPFSSFVGKGSLLTYDGTLGDYTTLTAPSKMQYLLMPDSSLDEGIKWGQPLTKMGGIMTLNDDAVSGGVFTELQPSGTKNSLLVEDPSSNGIKWQTGLVSQGDLLTLDSNLEYINISGAGSDFLHFLSYSGNTITWKQPLSLMGGIMTLNDDAVSGGVFTELQPSGTKNSLLVEDPSSNGIKWQTGLVSQVEDPSSNGIKWQTGLETQSRGQPLTKMGGIMTLNDDAVSGGVFTELQPSGTKNSLLVEDPSSNGIKWQTGLVSQGDLLTLDSNLEYINISGAGSDFLHFLSYSGNTITWKQPLSLMGGIMTLNDDAVSGGVFTELQPSGTKNSLLVEDPSSNGIKWQTGLVSQVEDPSSNGIKWQTGLVSQGDLLTLDSNLEYINISGAGSDFLHFLSYSGNTITWKQPLSLMGGIMTLNDDAVSGGEFLELSPPSEDDQHFLTFDSSSGLKWSQPLVSLGGLLTLDNDSIYGGEFTEIAPPSTDNNYLLSFDTTLTWKQLIQTKGGLLTVTDDTVNGGVFSELTASTVPNSFLIEDPSLSGGLKWTTGLRNTGELLTLDASGDYTKVSPPSSDLQYFLSYNNDQPVWTQPLSVKGGLMVLSDDDSANGVFHEILPKDQRNTLLVEDPNVVGGLKWVEGLTTAGDILSMSGTTGSEEYARISGPGGSFTHFLSYDSDIPTWKAPLSSGELLTFDSTSGFSNVAVPSGTPSYNESNSFLTFASGKPIWMNTLTQEGGILTLSQDSNSGAFEYARISGPGGSFTHFLSYDSDIPTWKAPLSSGELLTFDSTSGFSNVAVPSGTPSYNESNSFLTFASGKPIWMNPLTQEGGILTLSQDSNSGAFVEIDAPIADNSILISDMGETGKMKWIAGLSSQGALLTVDSNNEYYVLNHGNDGQVLSLNSYDPAWVDPDTLYPISEMDMDGHLLSKNSSGYYAISPPTGKNQILQYNTNSSTPLAWEDLLSNSGSILSLNGTDLLEINAPTQYNSLNSFLAFQGGSPTWHSPLSSLGSLLTYSGTNHSGQFVELEAGTDGQVLISDSGSSEGLSWVDGATVAPLNELMASGDLLYHNGSSITRLERGDEFQVLQATSTGIEWNDVAFVNPMNVLGSDWSLLTYDQTAGDYIEFGAPLSTEQLLFYDASGLSWQSLSTLSPLSNVATKGDILFNNGSILTNLPGPTAEYQYLTFNSGSGLAWNDLLLTDGSMLVKNDGTIKELEAESEGYSHILAYDETFKKLKWTRYISNPGDILTYDSSKNMMAALSTGGSNNNNSILVADNTEDKGMKWGFIRDLLPIDTDGSLLTFSNSDLIDVTIGNENDVLVAGIDEFGWKSLEDTLLPMYSTLSDGGVLVYSSVSNQIEEVYPNQSSGVTYLHYDNVSHTTSWVTLDVDVLTGGSVGELITHNGTNYVSTTLSALLGSPSNNAIVANTSSGFTGVGPGGAGDILYTSSNNGLPAWTSLASILPFTAQGQLLSYNGSSLTTLSAASSDNKILISDGTATTGLTWADIDSLIPLTQSGSLLTHSGTDWEELKLTGTSTNDILRVNGSSIEWTSLYDMFNFTAANSLMLSNGSSGFTELTAAGTGGTVLSTASSGGAPSWTSLTTLEPFSSLSQGGILTRTSGGITELSSLAANYSHMLALDGNELVWNQYLNAKMQILTYDTNLSRMVQLQASVNGQILIADSSTDTGLKWDSVSSTLPLT
ncbi:hypothetical protein ADUPG1_013075, partial [Aduncisulcus paluster]